MLANIRVPGIKTIRRAGHWIHSRFMQHALILGYHRVADEPHDLYNICVTPRHFQEQMEILHQFTNVICLQELVDGIRKGQFRRKSVVITFDDGYSDLLHTVKPILEEYHLPCTVFILTGFIGREFWWDELVRLENTNKTSSNNDILNFYRQMLALKPENRRQALQQLREHINPNVAGDSKSRALQLNELIELTKGELFEIGSHGVNHVSLGNITANDQEEEFLESKKYLENQLGKSIVSFSYPNGSSSITTRNLASLSGYNCACGSNQAVTYSHSDIYALPRFWIPDWDGKNFKRWLMHWN